MGAETSKEQDYYVPSQDKNTYENVVRAYATWDHRSGLASHDASRFTNHEVYNLNKHHQLSQNSSDQQKPIPSNITKRPSLHQHKKPNHSHSKKTYDDQIKQDKTVPLKENQSINQESYSKNVVTAEQLMKTHSQRKQRYRSTPSPSSNETSQNSPIVKPSTNINQFISSNKKQKQVPNNLQLVLINQSDLQNAREIGHGNFGTVHHALYKTTRDVALKTLNSRRKDCPNGAKSSIDDYDDISELLHEAHIMTHLQHPNLLRILGVTFFGKEKELCLVTDFMKNGSLLDYLRKNRDVFMKSDSKEITIQLNHFAKQIFEAMFYLEKENIIHRDLAARNCLIGEDNTLKVGDFGLTKLTECGLYKGTYRTICAVRWTSPEAIFASKYSSRSDVWSYGITLWEIYSLGERPYGDMMNSSIKNILKNPSENLSQYLPQSSQFGSDETYTHIILRCLTYNAAVRPHFKDLTERVSIILNQKNK